MERFLNYYDPIVKALNQINENNFSISIDNLITFFTKYENLIEFVLATDLLEFIY